MTKETLEPGPHAIEWDGRDDGGAVTASGLYFTRVDAAGSFGTGRIVRL